jgi:pathogenesis-related protein 1
MRTTIVCSSLLFLLGCNDGNNNNAKPLDPRLAEVLTTHNEVRASALPAPSPALPQLAWADDLAASAQTYAELCNFAHDSNLGFLGENLAVNAPAGFLDGRDVVLNWASELSDYDYDTNSCTGVCGHYTQIVWRDTAEVGCGVATCNGIQGFTANEGELWVCRYRDPGNFIGQKPY